MRGVSQSNSDVGHDCTAKEKSAQPEQQIPRGREAYKAKPYDYRTKKEKALQVAHADVALKRIGGQHLLYREQKERGERKPKLQSRPGIDREDFRLQAFTIRLRKEEQHENRRAYDANRRARSLFLPETNRERLKSEIFLDLFQVAIVVGLTFSAFFLLPVQLMLPTDALQRTSA